MGDLLVTDPVKLTTAGQNALNKWGVTSDALKSQRTNISDGIERWLWGPMLGAAYTQYQVVTPPPAGKTIRDLQCTPWGSLSQNWRAFDAEPESAMYAPVLGFTGSPGSVTPHKPQVWAIAHGEVGDRQHWKLPPFSLTDHLFQDIDDGGAGLFPPSFWMEAPLPRAQITPSPAAACSW